MSELLRQMNPALANLISPASRVYAANQQRRQSQPSAIYLDEEEERSMIGSLRDKTLTTVGALGSFLDLPGSMVRDVASSVVQGQFVNPFDQLLSPFSQDNRTSGQELLQQTGLADPRGGWKSAVAGFGLEVGMDPLTYMSFGASAGGKAFQAARAAGLMDDVNRVARAKRGVTAGKIGDREARMTTTLSDFLQFGNDAAKKKARDLVKRGVDPNEQLGAAIGFGLPFMQPSAVAGQGKLAQKYARGLDTAGRAARYANIPGTDIQPINALASLFDAPSLSNGRMSRTPEVAQVARETFRDKLKAGIDPRTSFGRAAVILDDLVKDPGSAAGREVDDFLKTRQVVPQEMAKVDSRLGRLTGELASLTQGQSAKTPFDPMMTKEVSDLLAKIDAGGAMPAFITGNLRKLAKEFGVPITGSSKPADVVDGLRKAMGGAGASPAAKSLDQLPQKLRKEIEDVAKQLGVQVREGDDVVSVMNAIRQARVAGKRVTPTTPGDKHMAISDAIREAIEISAAMDRLPVPLRKVAESIKAEALSAPQTARDAGGHMSLLMDEMIDYSARFIAEGKGFKGSRAASIGQRSPSDIFERLDFLRDVEGGTVKLKNEFLQDPALHAFVAGAKSADDITEFVSKNYSSVLGDTYKALNDKGKIVERTDRYKQLGEWLWQMDQETLGKGVFSNHVLVDNLARTASFHDAVVGIRNVTDFLSEPGILKSVEEAGRFSDTTVSLKELAEGMGVVLHQNMQLKKGGEKVAGGLAQALSKKLGKPINEIMDMRIDGRLAEDLKNFKQATSGPDAVHDILQMVDSWTNFSKGMWTSVWPAFHTRNLVSGQVQNAMLGMFSKRSLQWAKELQEGKVLKDVRKIEALGQEYANRMRSAGWDDAATKSNLTRAGYNDIEVERILAKADPIDPRAKAMEFGPGRERFMKELADSGQSPFVGSPSFVTPEEIENYAQVMDAYAIATAQAKGISADEFYAGLSIKSGKAADATKGALKQQVDVGGKQFPTTDSTGAPIHTTEEGVKNFWEGFKDTKVVDDQGRPLVVYHGTGNADLGTDVQKARNRESRSINAEIDDWEATHGAKYRELQSRLSRLEYDDPEYSKILSERKQLPPDPSRTKGRVGKQRVDESLEQPAFDTLRYGDNDTGYMSAGTYFTASPSMASGYAEAGLGQSKGVLPTYLNLKNPFVHGVTQDPRVDEMVAAAVNARSGSVVEDWSRVAPQARRDALIELGYDGEIYSRSQASKAGASRPDLGESEIVAFYPEQVKSATGNRGTFDTSSPNILYQTPSEGPNLGFYSKLAQETQSKVSGKVGWEQYERTMKKAGVKAEEMDDLGMKEFFASGPKTKAEIDQHIYDSAPLIEVVKQGGDGPPLQYPQVAIPGGEPGTQREILIRERSTGSFYRQDEDFRRAMHKKYGDGWTNKLSPEDQARHQELSREGERVAKRERRGDFTESHWSQKNVIAHGRIDDIVNPDGTRTMRIVEMQSDVHQKSRKLRNEAIDIMAEKDGIDPWRSVRGQGGEMEQIRTDEFREWKKKNKARIDQEAPADIGYSKDLTPDDKAFMRDIEAKARTSSIDLTPEESARYDRLFRRRLAKEGMDDTLLPDMPFKASSPQLVFKHLLKMAVEEGYDEVGLVVGRDAARASGGPVKELDEAYKIMLKDAKEYTKKYKSYVGETEVVGARGGDQFRNVEWSPFDRDGVTRAQLGDTELQAEIRRVSNDWYAASVGGNDVGGYPTLEQAKSAIANQAEGAVGGLLGSSARTDFDGGMHVFKITPEMREDILGKGQPLYQKGQTAPKGQVELRNAQATITAFENADFSTLVHETAHVFLDQLPLNLKREAAKVFGIQGKMKDGIETFVFNRKAHEEFATGFEKYLADGKAPTKALEAAFGKFKNWLTSIYRAIVGTPLEKQVHPELKKVFDQMLGGGQQPKAKRAGDMSFPSPGEGMAPAFDDVMATKMLSELGYGSETFGSFDASRVRDVAGGTEAMPGSLPEVLGSIPRPGQETFSMGRVLRKAAGVEPGTNFDPRNVRGVGGRTESGFAPAAAGEELGAGTEFLNRMAPFINQLEKGYDVAEASARVGAAQVLYSNRHYTPFEQKVMTRLLPFFKFSRSQIPFHAKQLLERPGGPYGQLTRGMGQMQQQGELAPEHVRDTASIPVDGRNPILSAIVGEAPEGVDRYIAGFGLMNEDLLSMSLSPRGLGQEFLGRSSPFVKGPLEWITNQSFFQGGPEGGRSLDKLDPTVGRLISNLTGQDDPVRLPGMLEQVLSNSPAARALTTLRTLSDPRKGGDYGPISDAVPFSLPGAPSLLNLLTGVRVTDVSPGAKDTLIRELLTREMKDAGASTFERVYFSKDELAKMGPEQRKAAENLQGLANVLARRAKERAKAREQQQGQR